MSNSARCSGNGLGSAQGNFIATPGVGNLLGNVLGATGASGLQIYVVGDQAASPYDNATNVTIGGAGVIENYVVYAPTSRVNVSNRFASPVSLVRCTSMRVITTGSSNRSDSSRINASLGSSR